MDKPNHHELVSTIRLIRSENIGIKTFWNLIGLYQTPSNALEHVAHLSLRGGKDKAIKIFSKADAESEIAA